MNLREVGVKHLCGLPVNCHGQLCLHEPNRLNAYIGHIWVLVYTDHTEQDVDSSMQSRVLQQNDTTAPVDCFL